MSSVTRPDPVTTESQRNPQVNVSLNILSQGSTEKSQELRQEPGLMDLASTEFLKSLRAATSPQKVLDSAEDKVSKRRRTREMSEAITKERWLALLRDVWKKKKQSGFGVNNDRWMRGSRRVIDLLKVALKLERQRNLYIERLRY
ncbi:unnamed protein product [Arabidopsis thaliana]|uniref:Uncharacterized protein n=1 Tax=Arabidopsis thaliana TaxID=3702 RepID=A0A5S9YHH5_ARATH|nr:unnamed protein product [Arabidopsis thaliana]